MKVKRDFFSLILVFIIIFVLTHLPRFSGTEGDEINLKNSNFAVGSVKRIYYGFKTGKLIEYQFFVNDKCYKSKSNTRATLNFENAIKKNNWPIIYNVNNPNINEILIFDEQFNKFNLSMPDTLYDVEKYSSTL